MFSKTLILTGLCVVVNAYATVLAPGGTATPVNMLPGTATFPAGTPNGVSAEGSQPFFQDDGAWSLGNKPLSASVNFDSAVWVDPNTGTLDFFYQLQNDYSGAATNTNTLKPVFTIDLFTLPGVTITGVAQITATNWNAAAAPDHFVKPTPVTNVINSVSLNAADDSLTVTMNSALAPSQNSAILVIETNARDFDQNGDGVLNWKSAPPTGAHGSGSTEPFDLGTLEPIATPEPGVYGALVLGLGGLFMVRRRSSKKSVDATPVV